MKVLLLTDMEGVAGITNFDMVVPDYKNYEYSKKLLTNEVNAAIDGFRDAGAKDVLVVDGHGGGGIDFDSLHPESRIMHGVGTNPCDIAYINICKEYDVAAIVGQHAMAGVKNGNMNHTQNAFTIDYYKLNGKLIGEIAQAALYLGAINIPLIFLSGDVAACHEAKELIPKIKTAEVKQGITRNYAISLSAPKGKTLIRIRAAEAIQQYIEHPFKPLKWKGPYTLEKRYFYTDTAGRAAMHALAERLDDQTVVLKSDDLLDIIYA